MKKYTIGIDVGGTNVKLGLVNSKGQIVARERFSTKSYLSSKSKLIKAIITHASLLVEEKKLKHKDIRGIGMGLPGLIDFDKGIVKYLPNIPGWKNVALKKMIEEKMKVPVFIDNDVNVITLGEWKLGAGKGVRNLVCITLGTGLGGGLILNGSLFRGQGYMAGEIGHIPFKDKVLETYVGNKSLRKKAGKIFKNKEITLEEVYRLAKLDNARAVQFWEELAEDIGFVMAGVVNVLNPGLIIVGGGVSNNFKFIKPKLQATIKAKAMEGPAKMVKVVRAKLGDDAGILGAQILVEESRSDR